MNQFHSTYFTVSSDRYFAGTVALLNSLRLSGNSGKFVVLDTGLAPPQRRRLAEHCIMVDSQVIGSKNPFLSKPFPYHLSPTGTVVLIDSDIIVTQSLDHILAEAVRGKICVVRDPEDLRWFEEWQELFDLADKPRRQTYVNSGFLAFSTLHWPRLLERWWEACQRIPPDHIKDGRGTLPDAEVPLSESRGRHGDAVPFACPDQDALNALLMSEFPPEALALQPAGVEVFQRDLIRVRVADLGRLVCTYDERRTTLLHYIGGPKPWQSAAWSRVRRDAYVRLLRRAVLANDVGLRLSQHDLPLWLRTSVRGRLTGRFLDMLHILVGAVLDRMPAQRATGVRQLVHTVAERLSPGAG